MLPRKSVIVLAIALVALAWMIPRQQRIIQARRALADAQRQKAEFEQRLVETRADREAAKQDLLEKKRSSAQTFTELSTAELELEKLHPEARWASPPVNGEWDDSSPYIWVPKDKLSTFPMGGFSPQAELGREVAGVLAIDAATLQTLNGKLTQLMTEYHELETANVERISEPLPGISNDGPQVTVRVKQFPEEGARLRKQFESNLREAVGQSRADLLIKETQDWLYTQFGQFGTEPKVISIVRHPNGTYNVSTHCGGSWLSTGGFTSITDYVPTHLLPLFSEVLDQPGESGAEPARDEATLEK